MLVAGKERSVADLAITGVVIVGGTVLAQKAYKKWRIQQASQQLGNSLPAQQATTIYSAFNPGSFLLLKWVDGTDEETLYTVAAQISDWAKVSDYYRILSNGGVLEADLRGELDTEELAKFYAILAKNNPNIEQPFLFGVGDEVQLTQTVKLFVYSPSPAHSSFTLTYKEGTPFKISTRFTWKGDANTPAGKTYSSRTTDPNGVTYDIWIPQNLLTKKVACPWYYFGWC